MKIFFLLITLLFLVACGPDESQFKSSVPAVKPDYVKVVSVVKSALLPDSINLDVPFYSQAPDEDWSLPWQEACEEASITLAYYAFLEEPLTNEQFKKDVLGLVDWQMEHFNDYISTTIDQTAQMLEGYFGFTDFRILENPTIEDLKTELAAGHIIVAPFAGRMLGNPFYSDEGPYYHMMVIKGYDKKNFITNDVGTKRGFNFIYSYATIMNAMHDYHPSAIQMEPKRVIVLESPAGFAESQEPAS